MINRHLSWNRCLNVRDLGGLRTRNNELTKWNALIRADSLDRLTQEGFQSLQNHGIKTIIDLRDEKEIAKDRLQPPEGLTRIHSPLEDQADDEFWNVWRNYNCTPFYYKPFLERSSQRVRAVFAEIAAANEGGIVFHCASGRDRTGLITIILLALAHVLPEEIARDYELSAPNLAPIIKPKEEQAIVDALTLHKTTLFMAVTELLVDFNAEEYLSNAGLTDTDIGSIRQKLIV